MPKAPEGFHKCADGKTIRKKIDQSGRKPNMRAKILRDQRRMENMRVEKHGRPKVRTIQWTGTGSRAYGALSWWGKLIYRIKEFFSERDKIRKKHKALYKKAGRVKMERQFTLRPIARREQHK